MLGMLLFGHIGITMAVVYLFTRYLSSRSKRGLSKSFAQDIDFRIVIVAAMLPDIVDKTVGMIIFKEEISNGRLFTHSIIIVGLISICLFSFAIIQCGHRLKPLFYISPIWIHLLLDRMWEDIHTLFWPVFGIGFPRIDIEFSDYWTHLLSDPYIYLSEILGALIIIIIIIRYRLFIKIRLFGFFRDGKLRIGSES